MIEEGFAFLWKDLPSNLVKAIRRQVNARIKESWKGSMSPESWNEVDREVKEADLHLRKVLTRLLLSYDE